MYLELYYKIYKVYNRLFPKGHICDSTTTNEKDQTRRQSFTTANEKSTNAKGPKCREWLWPWSVRPRSWSELQNLVNPHISDVDFGLVV